jgi:hypothetical protein
MPVSAPAAAQSINLVVGFSPGAAYDIYMRTLAHHIGKHLPGNPTVVPQNMAGAGSMRVANFLYNAAPKDGFTIGMFARGLLSAAARRPGRAVRCRRFNWIGGRRRSMVLSGTPRHSRSRRRARTRMVVGATGSGADSVIFPYILNGVLGTKFKVVTGYPGATDFLLAMERGETDGTAGVSWGTVGAGKPDWIREHKINILVQLGTRKHPDLGAAPLVLDFAKTETDRGVLELIFLRQEMAYPVVAPPGVPAGACGRCGSAAATVKEQLLPIKTPDARDRRGQRNQHRRADRAPLSKTRRRSSRAKAALEVAGSHRQQVHGEGATVNEIAAAVSYDIRRTEVRTFKEPDLPQDDGLLRVELCGVCGSDWPYYLKYPKARGALILGHEAVGHVARLGPAAAARFGIKEGDRVALEEYLPCGHCRYCRSGDFRLCDETDTLNRPPDDPTIRYGSTPIAVAPSLWGGYSQYQYLHPNAVFHRVPDHVPARAFARLPLDNNVEWTYLQGGVTRRGGW